MPGALLARCDPIRRQLLGDAATQLGYCCPTDEDAPLKAWQDERHTRLQS